MFVLCTYIHSKVLQFYIFTVFFELGNRVIANQAFTKNIIPLDLCKVKVANVPPAKNYVLHSSQATVI